MEFILEVVGNGIELIPLSGQLPILKLPATHLLSPNPQLIPLNHNLPELRLPAGNLLLLGPGHRTNPLELPLQDPHPIIHLPAPPPGLLDLPRQNRYPLFVGADSDRQLLPAFRQPSSEGLALVRQLLVFQVAVCESPS